ncbi:MAG: acyl-CoA dehydrogenase family protein [Acidobacteriota bacterium]
MDYELSDEQNALRDLAREFARREMDPVAAEHDRSAQYPAAVVAKAFDVGLINLNVPEAYGGPGLSVLDECLVAEELSAGCVGITASLGLNALSATPILLAGSGALQAKYLPRLTRDRSMASYALSEPDMGSDVASLATRATRVDGGYRISGTKNFISNASIASFYIVFASTDRAMGARGITAFVVEKAFAGVTVGKKDDKMGQRAADTAQLHFDDVFVPEENRIGADGEGFKVAMRTFDRTRPAVAALAVGVARRALEHAVAYAGQRKTFGRPIAEHEGIAFKLADMATLVAAARHLTRHAAWLVDHGKPNTLEASMAKAFAADACMKVTTEAVQVFGGYGYMKEYPVEKLMRDAKVFQIYEGTSEIQRLIIARELARRS